ncbi:tRNA-dependent cyclodipeptide synthase [Photorhabdus cinerea]|uniref:Cyclodipeptide synthase n=1 Tax=Photorhabdus cinerea TaxID=471575 RepID=A0A7X5QGJ1_9GAMM|nr:tRNA-dependent cyclodipeptide synthase [Photorhabdus cinerea]NHB93953.1 tRNA-dependent cyclodipeptide synthase [Photorhabdus cinerea]
MTIIDNYNVIPFLRNDQYRAKIAFVSPQSRRNTFESETECFLGVSLENRNFQPNRFHALVKWASRRFSTCKILIGDSIHRITLETMQGFSQEEALSRAIQIGQNFMKENQNILDTFSHATKFEYITCAKTQKTSDYKLFKKIITEYFESSKKFRFSVEEFGKKFHRHKWDTLNEAEKLYRIKQSSEYFLEEFAVFACLVKNGNSVMIYPGAFSSLAEITDGKFPGFLPELEALTVVSINLKRR